MVSETEQYPPTTLRNLEVNTLADGIFHATTWIFVFAGLWWLWRAVGIGGGRWGWGSLLSWLATGWGLFNLVEGIVNHHLLQIHRVHPEAASPEVWDIGFLAVGVLLVAGGVPLRTRST